MDATPLPDYLLLHAPPSATPTLLQLPLGICVAASCSPCGSSASGSSSCRVQNYIKHILLNSHIYATPCSPNAATTAHVTLFTCIIQFFWCCFFSRFIVATCGKRYPAATSISCCCCACRCRCRCSFRCMLRALH